MAHTAHLEPAFALPKKNALAPVALPAQYHELKEIQLVIGLVFGNSGQSKPPRLESAPSRPLRGGGIGLDYTDWGFFGVRGGRSKGVWEELERGKARIGESTTSLAR